MIRRYAVALVLFSACLQMDAAPAKDYAQEDPADRAARMAWFDEARFGMFIHWGLYAIPAGVWNGNGGHGEWIRHTAKIPIGEYDQLVDQFNPVNFNADEWAQIAKEAGMKYMVITSKHHDGFALWDSAVSDFDMMATPFRRDILKELREACDRAGIRLCLYHSIMDWHHPDYLPRRKWEIKPSPPGGATNAAPAEAVTAVSTEDEAKYRSTEEADYGRYVTYMKAQLKELITGYGPLGILWFDGEWESTWTHPQGVDLYNYVRDLQPDIIINNRVDKGRKGMAGMTKGSEYAGDYGTPEQEIPARGFGPGVAWESCMTMNANWGYTLNRNWKSSEDLIHKLVDIVSKGGNFLLNVGPKADGRFPQESVDRLRDMGRWLRVNGESVYGTTASPFNRLPWRCTKRPGKLYVHLFEWPEEGVVVLPGLKNEVHAAYLLADTGKTGLPVTRDESEVRVQLPNYAPDAFDSVLVLEVTGEPEAEAISIMQAGGGSLELCAKDADIHGSQLGYEGPKDCLGFWTDPNDWASWTFRCTAPGRFQVELDVAAESASAGGTYTLSVAGQSLTGTVPDTGSWDDFVTVKPGRVILEEKGDCTLSVKGEHTGHALMNLRAVRLKPEGAAVEQPGQTGP